MEAGRKLDLLVVETVFDWRIDHGYEKHWSSFDDVNLDNLILTPSSRTTDKYIFHGSGRLLDVPFYSTDITAAVLVEQEIKRRGGIYPKLYIDALGGMLLGYTGQLSQIGTTTLAWIMRGVTPSNICNAALIAYMVAPL